MLAEGLAFKHINAGLVVVAHQLGIDPAIIANEVIRQLDEMPSKEKH